MLTCHHEQGLALRYADDDSEFTTVYRGTYNLTRDVQAVQHGQRAKSMRKAAAAVVDGAVYWKPATALPPQSHCRVSNTAQI
jgi:hypothetical protein